MRLLSLLAVASLVSSALVAQSQVFSINGRGSSFTSRARLGTRPGETLMGLHKSHWRGLADNGTRCEITQIGLVDQDQNSNTQESFHLLIRSGTDATGPATGVAGRIARFGPLLMPSTPTGSINAWIQTVTPRNPAAIPCESHRSWGAELTNSPNWPADGMSCHSTTNSVIRNLLCCHRGAQPHGYYFVTGSARATAELRTWRMRFGLSTDRQILQLGATGRNLDPVCGTMQHYGMGGMFPGTGQTLSARITQCRAGDAVSSYLCVGFLPGGLAISPGTRLWVNPSPLVLQVGLSVAIGSTVTHLLGVTPAVLVAVGPLPIQAVVVRRGVMRMTNANATTIL